MKLLQFASKTRIFYCGFAYVKQTNYEITKTVIYESVRLFDLFFLLAFIFYFMH